MRLTTTTIGPVPVVQGQAGKTQSLGARNAGDGSLNLSFTSSVSWLSASRGGNIACSDNPGQTCLGINVSLATAALPKGIATGTLRVIDPNADDAPQDVIVTVQVGGLPDSMTFYVKPDGSTVTQSLKTTSNFQASSTPLGGGVTLKLVSNGVGSFATTFGYDVQVSAQPGTAEATYSSTISVSGSATASDNKQVPVSIQVTSAPIATPLPATVPLKVISGSSPQSVDINFWNTGMSDLAVTGADPGSSTWLTAQINGNTVTAVADPTGLASGVYTGALTIASNAVNPVSVPVILTVVDGGAPVSTYQSVVSITGSAPSSDPVALGDVATIQGELFTTQPPQSADATQSLPTTLGGATVYVNDVAAPIFSVSSGKIQFQVPYEVNSGSALVRVDRDGNTGNRLSLSIQPTAPRVTGAQNQNGAPVLGNGAPVAVGDTLTFWGYGFGATNPSIASGTPASDGMAVDPSLVVHFSSGGLFGVNVTVSPQSATLVTGAIGLYQVVVVVPDRTPHGPNVQVTLEYPNASASKSMSLNIP